MRCNCGHSQFSPIFGCTLRGASTKLARMEKHPTVYHDNIPPIASDLIRVSRNVQKARGQNPKLHQSGITTPLAGENPEVRIVRDGFFGVNRYSIRLTLALVAPTAPASRFTQPLVYLERRNWESRTIGGRTDGTRCRERDTSCERDG